MGRNRLNTTNTGTREATPLEYAMAAWNRVRSYGEPADLSSNERAILTLGNEVQRLTTALHRAEMSLRHLTPAAK